MRTDVAWATSHRLTKWFEERGSGLAGYVQSEEPLRRLAQSQLNMVELDEIDYGILHLLQEDARHQTPVDMAEHLPVSAQTIRNRIENMEERGVIEGYDPVINYQKAGFPIRLVFTCTAPLHRRQELATEVLELPHIVRVEEMLSANENLRLLAVTNDSEEINEIASELDTLGLTIESERLLRHGLTQPFNHFGENIVSEE